MTQNDPANRNIALSPKQVLAMPFIAAAPTVSEGARSAGIGRATLVRWQKDPYFRAELERMRKDAAALAYVELQGLVLKSINTLAELLDDGTPAVRLSAVRAALRNAFKANEHQDIRNHFDVIDRAIHLLKNQP